MNHQNWPARNKKNRETAIKPVRVYIQESKKYSLPSGSAPDFTRETRVRIIAAAFKEDHPCFFVTLYRNPLRDESSYYSTDFPAVWVYATGLFPNSIVFLVAAPIGLDLGGSWSKTSSEVIFTLGSFVSSTRMAMTACSCSDWIGDNRRGRMMSCRKVVNQ